MVTKFMISLLLLLAIPSVANAHLPQERPLAPVYERVASSVAEHRLRIQCEPLDLMPGSALGYVSTADLSVVHLGPWACGALSSGPSSPSFGDSLLVLIHEAEHARGVVSESEANCLALGRVGELARRFFYYAPTDSIMAGALRLFSMTPPEYRRC